MEAFLINYACKVDYFDKTEFCISYGSDANWSAAKTRPKNFESEMFSCDGNAAKYNGSLIVESAAEFIGVMCIWPTLQEHLRFFTQILQCRSVQTIAAFNTTLMQFLRHCLKMYFLRRRIVKMLITPFCQSGRLCKLLSNSDRTVTIPMSPSRNTIKRGFCRSAEIYRKAAYNTRKVLLKRFC